MKFIYLLLLIPFTISAQNYTYKTEVVKVDLSLEKVAKDSLVVGEVTIQNISNSDILILKNDPNMSGSTNSDLFIIDLQDGVTDPLLNKNRKISFYHIKPNETIKIEKKSSFDWKQLSKAIILFNIIPVSNIECKKCRKKIDKSINDQSNVISGECLMEYQNKHGSGQVAVTFKV